MNKDKNSGFTLIELLVVIAIIGLLSTMAMVGLNGARKKARDTKRVADVRQVMMSLELYSNESNGYPVEATPVLLGQGNYAALCESGFTTACAGSDVTFQGLVPTAPIPVESGCTTEQNGYSYITGATGEYEIGFCLGGAVGDLGPGPHIATPSGMQ